MRSKVCLVLAIVLWTALALTSPTAPMRACVPEFPLGLLEQPDRPAPALDGTFSEQVRRLLAPADSSEPGFPWGTESGWFADRTSLNRLPAAQRDEALVGRVRQIRHRITEYNEELSDWRRARRYGQPVPGGPRPELGDLAAPQRLPVDLRLYLDGAIAYHQGDVSRAEALWKEILELPPASRRERSVMATYMLARTAKDAWVQLGYRLQHAARTGDPHEASMEAEREAAAERAVALYRDVRELAGTGFYDDLSLAHDSLGWEAYVELHSGGYAQALHLYAEQVMAGNLEALESIEASCAILSSQGPAARPDVLQDIAVDPVAREIYSLYLATEGLGEGSPGWFAALRGADVKPSSAGLVAWTAYQAGQFEAARQWCEISPEDDPNALWVHGQLAARDGRLGDAALALDRAARALGRRPPVNERFGPACTVNPVASRAAADAARVELDRGHYQGALDRFLRTGHWRDAAYVAERVMTPAELQSYVDKSWPLIEKPKTPWSLNPCLPPTDIEIAAAIRSLLARRLAREVRWDAAAGYYLFLGDGQTAKQMGESLRCADDPDCSIEEQAAGLWRSAQCLRDRGLDLVGSELAPDWKMEGAAFDLGETIVRPGAPAEEAERVRRSRPEPSRRHHYRYLAADLAWRAAERMPNGSEATANVLWTAGRWLAARDPEAADRFYKALVRRCGNTPLGRDADRRRWFPPAEP